jgi:hypothetical protein
VEFHSGATRRDPACARHAKKPARSGINNCDMQRIWLRFRIIPIPLWQPQLTPIETRNQLQLSGTMEQPLATVEVQIISGIAPVEPAAIMLRVDRWSWISSIAPQGVVADHLISGHANSVCPST